MCGRVCVLYLGLAAYSRLVLDLPHALSEAPDPAPLAQPGLVALVGHDVDQGQGGTGTHTQDTR